MLAFGPWRVMTMFRIYLKCCCNIQGAFQVQL